MAARVVIRSAGAVAINGKRKDIGGEQAEDGTGDEQPFCAGDRDWSVSIFSIQHI